MRKLRFSSEKNVNNYLKIFNGKDIKANLFHCHL